MRQRSLHNVLQRIIEQVPKEETYLILELKRIQKESEFLAPEQMSTYWQAACFCLQQSREAVLNTPLGYKNWHDSIKMIFSRRDITEGDYYENSQ